MQKVYFLIIIISDFVFDKTFFKKVNVNYEFIKKALRFTQCFLITYKV